jgi:hypothetical protein
VRITGAADSPRVTVQVATTDGDAGSWVARGTFAFAVDAQTKPELRVALAAQRLGTGVLERLVRARLTKGQRVKGKETYKLQIDNVSPLVLDGVALAGPAGAAEDVVPFAALSGLSIAPRRSLTLSATPGIVEQLKLKKGVRVVAADLSAL